MNNGSSSTSGCIIKEVHSQLPQQSAVAVERRKEKVREAEKQGYGRTDKPRVTVTLRADNESDTDDPTIERGNSDSDNDYSSMNDVAEDDALVNATGILKNFHLDKSDGEGPSAVADTAKEKQIVMTPSAVADSAKENCVEDTSAAVAIDRKDDGPTAVPNKNVKPTQIQWSLSQSGM